MVLSRALARIVAALAAAAVATLVAAAPGPLPQAGLLRGRVEIAHPLSSSRPAHGVDPMDMEPAVAETYKQAVVFLDPAPEPLERLSEARVRMDQKDERFIPHLLAITAGTTVDFPNDDRIYHNVFSLSKTKRFDLGRYATGRSKAVRFEQAGIVRVFCEIHSHMNAFILVFDHRFFAITDDQGRFHIDRIPPGTYRVTAWYEGASRQTKPVTIPPSGSAEVGFELR